MIIAIRVPVLKLPFVISAYVDKPFFSRKVSERSIGDVNGYNIVREDYKGTWPFTRRLTAYRVYETESGKEVSYGLGFSFIGKKKRRAFYLQRFKTRRGQKSILPNLRSLEEKVVEDIGERCDYVVGFIRPKLIKLLRRKLGYREMKFEGLASLLNCLGTTLFSGKFMIKNTKPSSHSATSAAFKTTSQS